MIACNALTARRASTSINGVTLALEAGRHALLGRADDGVSVLVAAMAGEVRASRGSVTVLGGNPAAPAVRARVGWIPLDPRLPDVLRVDETIALARSIRRNAVVDASSVLAPLGLESLAKRRVDSLDPSEARAVALAEAIASPSVTVLLIEEPFVSMAAPAVAALPSVLAARKNTCTVVTTASARDAALLATDFAIFERGKLLRTTTDSPLRVAGDKPRIVVTADDMRALAAALAQKPEVARLELAPHALIVEGSDALALAAAVNAAIVDARADVRRIELGGSHIPASGGPS